MSQYIMIRSGLTRGGRVWHKGETFDGKDLPEGFPTRVKDQKEYFKGGVYFVEVDSEVAEVLLGSTNEEPGNVSPNTIMPNSDIYAQDVSPQVEVDESILESIPDNPLGEEVDMTPTPPELQDEEEETQEGDNNDGKSESNSDPEPKTKPKSKSTKKSKGSSKSGSKTKSKTRAKTGTKK